LAIDGTKLVRKYLYTMKKNTASRTAQYMALYRAMEAQRPARRRLFTDPYAKYFLDRGLRLAAWATVFSPFERLLYGYLQRRIPGSLASGLARTRLIDDWLESWIYRGIRQVIVLGAGFDTRSLRLQALRSIPVIEIDHPATAHKKLSILRKVLPSLPENTRYLSIDFDKESLEELFDREGIDFTLPTFFIWEGVTNYLQPEAINGTFALAGRFAEGSVMLFTYIHRQVLDEPTAFFGAERLLRDVEDIQERWTFGFVPEELPAYLRAYGFELMEDAGAAEYRGKYLAERKSILKGYEFYRVAMAVKRG
jgi:methyltransferase (TIGR00027 family)